MQEKFQRRLITASLLISVALFWQGISEAASPPHTVTFVENATTGTTVLASQTSSVPTSLTSWQLLRPAFSNPGHIFLEWTTQKSGAGTIFQNQGMYSFASNLTLYAQWITPPKTVTFAENDSQTDNVVAFQNANSLKSLELESQLTPQFHNGNLVFTGWNTKANGKGTSYSNGQQYSFLSDLTLYAQWSPNTGVTILEASTGGYLETFDAHGGSGRVASQKVAMGSFLTIPSGASLHRSGYVFKGWSTLPRAVRPTVRIGQRIKVTAGHVYYAVWAKSTLDKPQVLLGSIGTFPPNSITLSPSMLRVIESMALSVRAANRSKVTFFGYATSADHAVGSAALSERRAGVVASQLKKDLAALNDIGVQIVAQGEGQLGNPILKNFRNVEVYAN